MKLYASGFPSWLTQTDIPVAVRYEDVSGRKRAPASRGPWIMSPPLEAVEMPVLADLLDRIQERNQAFVGMGATNLDPDLIIRQRLSVELLIRLRGLELPALPVIHVQVAGDGARAMNLYEAYGIDLTQEPLVVLGEAPEGRWAARDTVRELCAFGLRLHAHNQSRRMLHDYATWLESADPNREWVSIGRQGPQLITCTHKNCSSCLDWALLWHHRLARTVEGQDSLFEV